MLLIIKIYFLKLILDITGEYMWDSFNLNTYFEENFAVETIGVIADIGIGSP